MFPSQNEKVITIAVLSTCIGILVGVSGHLIDSNFLKASDYVTLISVLAVVIGWIVNSKLNRKHEIFKKRLDYRLKMRESYIPAAATLEKLFNPANTEKTEELCKEFIAYLESSQIQILMFGTPSEIRQIEQIVQLARLNKHVEMKNASAALMSSLRENLRQELGFETVALGQ